jgi:hypothetical protein
MLASRVGTLKEEGDFHRRNFRMGTASSVSCELYPESYEVLLLIADLLAHPTVTFHEDIYEAR